MPLCSIKVPVSFPSEADLGVGRRQGKENGQQISVLPIAGSYRCGSSCKTKSCC